MCGGLGGKYFIGLLEMKFPIPVVKEFEN